MAMKNEDKPLAYHLTKLEGCWNDLVIFPIMDALADLATWLTGLIQNAIEWYQSANTNKEKPHEESKSITVEGITRVLYLRTSFKQDECERLALCIIGKYDAVDLLEFSICASNLGYSSDEVLKEFRHHGYSHKIKYWRGAYHPAFWDCTLSASDFEDPRKLLSSNVLVRDDGERLVIEDAPPIEMWRGKRK